MMATALLAGTTMAAPSKPMAAKRSAYTPTPVADPWAGATPTPYYSGGTYSSESGSSDVDGIYPTTDLETALVDYICSAYYEYMDSDSDSDAYDPSSDDSTNSDSKKKLKAKRQDESADSSDDSDYSTDGSSDDYSDDSDLDDSDDYEDLFASTQIEELLVEVLCSNYDGYVEAYYDDAEGGEKVKRSARSAMPLKRSRKAVSARSASKAGKLRARRAGKKSVKLAV